MCAPKITSLLLIALLGFAACGGSSPSDPPNDTDDTLTVTTPMASPKAGNYDSAQTVELTCATSGAEIRYTTAGGDPAAVGIPYTGAITISATTTLKAIAVKDGMNNSPVLTAVYTITAPGQVATPTASPGTGDYNEVQSVSLSTATQDTAIYYTLDGITDPTEESAPYEEGHPIAITKTTTLKAIAVKEGMEDSAVLTEVYTITLADDVEDFDGAEVTQVYDAANAEDWEAALTGIIGGGPDKNYVINITKDFKVEGSTAATFGDVTGLKVSIRGGKTVSLLEDGATGNVLRIGAEQTVIVRDVDFTGMTDNDASLLYLDTGALVTLKGNASVKGNTYAYYPHSGGGVYVNGGTFTMRDTASVSGNTSSSSAPSSSDSCGGGVYVTNDGTFTMHDTASVSNNTCSSSASSSSYGGGVHVEYRATFTMRDNTSVFHNTSSASTRSSHGGGVHVGVGRGTFIMLNTASVSDNTSFTSTYDNIYPAYGGGVDVEFGTFIMRDTASVSGNTSQSQATCGGGVYVGNATFQIASGTVYGNTSGADSNKVITHHDNPQIYDGAALFKSDMATAQRGTFSGDLFTSKNNLETTDTTIKVEDGELVQQ